MCGRVHDPAARFCSNCGQTLASQRPLSEGDTLVGAPRPGARRLRFTEPENATVYAPRPTVEAPAATAPAAAHDDVLTRLARSPRPVATMTRGAVMAAVGTRAARRAARAAIRQRREVQTTGTADPVTCALLSFFFPGAGHLLARRWRTGALLIVLAFVAVHWVGLGAFEGPMLVARLICALAAYNSAKHRRNRLPSPNLEALRFDPPQPTTKR